MFKLNYKRKLSDQIGQVLGPNIFGERLVVVGQDFDAKAKRTTLTLDIYRGN